MSEVVIDMPDPLRNRLLRLASAAQRPMEELVISALSDAVPSPPAGLSAELHEELASMETLSDAALKEIAQETMSPDDAPAPYEVGDETDRLALRKAYALALLKWRGHRPDELDRIAL